MTSTQENQVTAFQSVDYYLNKDTVSPIWQADPDLSAYIAQLGTAIDEILAFGTVQETDTTGTAAHKRTVKYSLITAMLKVIEGTVAHAVMIGDIELQEAADFTLTDLVRARDTILVEQATLIYEKAWPLRVQLVARRISEADITLVSTLKEEYYNLLPQPRDTIVTTKGATSDLGIKIRETSGLLRNKIDRLIRPYRTDHAGFVKGYFDSRIIVNSGVRRSSKSAMVFGTVYIAGTKIPLSNVSVIQSGFTKEIKTNSIGQYKILYRKSLMLTLLYHLEGYTDQTIGPFPLEISQKVQKNIYLEASE
jgi:hypothetical protein